MLARMMGDEELESAPKKRPNGLKSARQRKRMTQQQTADAMSMSLGGYTKIEHGDRGMNDEFIRKACEVLGAKSEEILLETNVGGIDQEKLEMLVVQARALLSSLSEIEAKNLVSALISASRKP
jgi:transcriptional regulator with XRE-family HTH domain